MISMAIVRLASRLSLTAVECNHLSVFRPVTTTAIASQVASNRSAIRKYSGINRINIVTMPTAANRDHCMGVRNMAHTKEGSRRPTIVTQDITKNLQLFTEQPRSVEHDPKTMRLTVPLSNKPLVVMLCWLQAQQKHVVKFAKLYQDLGLDVLAVRITPWQLLWPMKGTQLVARDLLLFLHANANNAPLFLHGFSVGGYMWGECLVLVSNELAKCKDTVIDRIIGQVWDSAADITEIPIGVPKAMFPKNATLQNALRTYMLYHMKAFHEPATSHYIRSSQMFHGNLVHTPALFFISKTDPVGAENSNQRVRENWERNNTKITWKCWDKSPHVGHFQHHREEYIAYLMEHLESVNLVERKEAGRHAVRAKL